MKFNLFKSRTEAYISKSLEYLQEANLGRVEHQVAAEHHAALAKMYAERSARIESEIKDYRQKNAPAVKKQIKDLHESIEINHLPLRRWDMEAEVPPKLNVGLG